MPAPETKHVPSLCSQVDEHGGNQCTELATTVVVVASSAGDYHGVRSRALCATHLVTFAYENVRQEWERKGRR